MSTQNFVPSGRLCVRKTQSGYVTVGVLHFPPGFRPEEGTGYPVAVHDGGIFAIPFAVDVLPEHLGNGGFSDWASAEIWRSLQGGFQARFVEAFRESNGWSVLAVTRNDPFESLVEAAHRDASHYWLDVRDGEVFALQSPCSVDAPRGMAVSQVLTNLCVWPNAQGEPYTLPVLPRPTRALFEVVSAIAAQQGVGGLSYEAAKSIRDAVPALSSLSATQKDPEYLEYIGVAQQYGMTTGAGEAMTKLEAERHEAFASLAVGALLKGRLDEPDVIAELELVSSPEAFANSSSYLMTEAWDFVFDRGVAETTRWVMSATDDTLLVAQVHSVRGWVNLKGDGRSRLLDSLVESDVRQALGEFGIETTRVLPGWASAAMKTKSVPQVTKPFADVSNAI